VGEESQDRKLRAFEKISMYREEKLRKEFEKLE